MSTPEDAVLAYWKEHREQLRQSENQRAVLTNYVLVIVAAISGFIVQQHFDLRTLPLSVLIVVIGLYGALAVAKYHERADYHLSQARALTRVLIDTTNGDRSWTTIGVSENIIEASWQALYDSLVYGLLQSDAGQ